jgi:hypothetical protein
MSHRRGPRSNTGRMVGASAVVLTVVVSATGAWFYGAGTVRAPEPASLRATLGTTQGSTAAATGPSGTPTTIMRWPASAQQNKDGTPRAGQPCTTTAMMPTQQTAKVIHEFGSVRACY